MSKSRWQQVTTKVKGQDREVPVPHLFRYLPTGVIYVRARFGREGIPRLFKSTGETTLGRAKMVADQLIQKHRNKHLGIDDSRAFGKRPASGGELFGPIAEEVLAEHTPTVRPATQVKHRRYIPALIKEWGDRPIESITVPEFKKWIQKLRGQKFGPNLKPGERGYKPPRLRKTFEGFSKHMNLVFRWAYENGRIKHLMVFPNPDKAVIAARKGRRYTDDELKALWAAMNEDLRDQFVLASECYMRLNEALKLEWSRVDVATGIVRLDPEHVKTGSKTGKGRTFYLSEFALERIRRRYAKRNPKSPWVFPSPKNPQRARGSNKTAWNATKRRAGLDPKEKATWHHLRHTALSRTLLESGQHPVKVSEYAGVHMVTIQKVYLHSRPEETREVASGARLPIPVDSGTNESGRKVGKRRASKKSKDSKS